MTATIAEQVAERHQASAGPMPADVAEAFTAEQRGLATAGRPPPSCSSVSTLTKVNADGTTTLPMPTVVMVDDAGGIRWLRVHADYTTRTEPNEVLHAVTQTIR